MSLRKSIVYDTSFCVIPQLYSLLPRNYFEHHLSVVTFVIFLLHMCDALRDLVSYAQFKKREKHLWRSETFSKASHIDWSKYLIKILEFH